jgi:hypothetical protein
MPMLNAPQTRYDLSLLVGVVGLAAVILIGMAGVIVVWASMIETTAAVRP